MSSEKALGAGSVVGRHGFKELLTEPTNLSMCMLVRESLADIYHSPESSHL